MAQCVTVFRSRLRPDVPDEYWSLARELKELATEMPGFIEHKVFVADDGERLTLVVFATPEAEAAWRDHVVHRAAQRRGRDEFYEAYDVSVCALTRRRRWPEPRG
jgi:heme-degrading monooxygenase HmoA